MSPELQLEFIDVAIDALCNGCNPHGAMQRACEQLKYSSLTLATMLSLEEFANGGIFEGNCEDHAKRIARLQKLRGYIQTPLAEKKPEIYG